MRISFLSVAAILALLSGDFAAPDDSSEHAAEGDSDVQSVLAIARAGYEAALKRRSEEEVEDRERAKRVLEGLDRRIPEPAGDDPEGENDAPLGWPRGLAWLAFSQRRDGHWNGTIGGSALAMLAITASEPPRETVATAELRSLLQLRHDPASLLDRRTNVTVRDCAIAIHAYCEVPAVCRSRIAVAWVQALAHWLESELERSKPWSKKADEAPMGPAETAWVLVAMDSLRSAEIQSSLLAIRLELRSDHDEASMVASLLWQRLFGGDADDDASDRLSEQLARCALNATNRSAEMWYLGHLALQDGRARHWRTWILASSEALARAQKPNGMWTSKPLGDVEATALAVLILRASEPFRSPQGGTRPPSGRQLR